MNASSKIPEHWIARLFAKMLAIWGDGYTRKWAGVDLDELKATWAQALAGFNEASLKRGYAAMFHEKYPPDLPRFIELCRIAPEHIAPSLPAIAHDHRITPEGEAALAKIHAMLKPLAQRSEVQGDSTGIEWAFRIIKEAQVSIVPLNKLTIAQDAIKAWCASHHCVRNNLDENGKWKHGSKTATYEQREEIELPARVPSPHIESEDEVMMREPGEDDE